MGRKYKQRVFLKFLRRDRSLHFYGKEDQHRESQVIERRLSDAWESSEFFSFPFNLNRMKLQS